jgi:hypothetical protein
MNRGNSSALPLRARRFGGFEGTLSELSAIELRDLAIREAVHRMALDPSQTGECLMGCVLVEGLDQDTARHAVLALSSLALSPRHLAKDASLWKSSPQLCREISSAHLHIECRLSFRTTIHVTP